MSSSAALLEALQQRGEPATVAVVGAGAAGRSILRQLVRAPGIRVLTIISRSRERAQRAWREAPLDAPRSESWSPDPRDAAAADIVIEATGDPNIGLAATLAALEARRHVLSFSAETESLFGPYFGALAAEADVVCGFADGDQPGVIVRLLDDMRLRGFDVRGLVNCKGFLDRHATPESVAPWVPLNCGTSARMTTSFADGTKLALEMAVVANATGFLPGAAGMRGMSTDEEHVARDMIRLHGPDERFVSYTLGGNFGGGVGLVCRDADVYDSELLRYYKMGRGPVRFVFRPYHLGPFEVVASIAEALVLRRPTVRAQALRTLTVAHAKRYLAPGTALDGIGGRDVYGQLYRFEEVCDGLPVSLAEGAVVKFGVDTNEPLTLDDVELAPTPAVHLYLDKVRASKPSPANQRAERSEASSLPVKRL